MNSLQDCLVGARDLAGRATTLFILLALGLTACHSSNDSGQSPPPPPPPPAPSGIGPAGGTVNGPNGSSVVIPAGALTAFVNIAIAQSSAGAPALPPGTEVAGEIYSFTPHGTTFAVPVRVTVPFDPALVPAGRNPGLLKTNATNTAWDEVAPVTANGSLLSADVSGFSYMDVITYPGLPIITLHPVDISVPAGNSASFSVTANPNGAPLSYQWFRDGTEITGATGAGYTLATATLADDGATFAVVVTNSVGSVQSQSAVLTVSGPPPAGTWQTIGGVVNAAGPVRFPAVAVSPDSTVYVAYVEGSSGVAGLEGSLLVRRWDSVAQSWVPVGSGTLNAGIGTAPNGPALRVGTDGVPVIAWVSVGVTSGSTNEVVVQRWNSIANAWQRVGGAPSGVSGGALRAGGVQLFLGPGDQPHVFFSEGICNVYRGWSGSAWEPDTQRACATSNQSAGGMVVRSNGVVFVAGSPSVPPEVNGVFTELRNWIAVRYRGENDQGFFASQLGATVNPVVADEFLSSRVVLGTYNTFAETPIVAYASRTGSGVSQVITLNVRAWEGTFWAPMGNELLAGSGLVNSSGVRMAVSPARTGIAWLTSAFSSTHIAGRLWTGVMWETMASPHASNANIQHFDVAVGPDARPYFAVAEIPPGSGNASALYVRTCDNWCVVP